MVCGAHWPRRNLSPRFKEVVVTALVTAHHEVSQQTHKPSPIFDNSPTFRMARRQLETVAEHLDIDPGVLSRLANPKRAMVVSLPVLMEDGTTEVFYGYRVQHSLTSGPSKGGL